MHHVLNIWKVPQIIMILKPEENAGLLLSPNKFVANVFQTLRKYLYKKDITDSRILFQITNLDFGISEQTQRFNKIINKDLKRQRYCSAVF